MWLSNVASHDYATVVWKWWETEAGDLFVVWNGTVKNNIWIPSAALRVKDDGNVIASWDVTATAFLYSSDRRLKSGITKIDSALDKINKLNGYNFTWKSNGRADMWVIAQEVEAIFPSLVKTSKETGMKSVEYGNLVAPLIEAIKELTVKAEDIFDKYVSQQERINELEQRIERLEALLLK